MTNPKLMEESLLSKLLGQRITLFCDTYIYTGDLLEMDEDCVKLKNAAIVYATGEFSSKEWQDAQKLPNEWYVQLSKIESFGRLK